MIGAIMPLPTSQDKRFARLRALRGGVRVSAVKVLAIDPGTRRTGYAVLESPGRLSEYGVLTIRGKNLPSRLLEIHRSVERLFRKHRPRHMAIERPFVGRNGASAMTLASARAVCLLAAAAARAEVFDYAPTQVKKAVSMNGLSSKATLQRIVQLLFGLREPPPADAADAVALGLCHLHRSDS